MDQEEVMMKWWREELLQTPDSLIKWCLKLDPPQFMFPVEKRDPFLMLPMNIWSMDRRPLFWQERNMVQDLVETGLPKGLTCWELEESLLKVLNVFIEVIWSVWVFCLWNFYKGKLLTLLGWLDWNNLILIWKEVNWNLEKF